jgi:hypothetical protein
MSNKTLYVLFFVLGVALLGYIILMLATVIDTETEGEPIEHPDEQSLPIKQWDNPNGAKG